MTVETVFPLALSVFVTALVLRAEARQKRQAAQWREKHDAEMRSLLCGIEDTIRKAARK